VSEPERLDPDPGAFAERRVATPDGSLAVRTRGLPGAGRPVLLLPGLGSNARIFDALAWRLAGVGHPVAAVDLPGHGGSDRPAGGFTWPGLVAGVAAVINELAWTAGDRHPVLVGHHLGANLAVEVATTDPTLPAALVLIDGGTMELADRFADWPTCAVALAPTVPEGSDGARVARMTRAVHADWPQVWRDDGTVGPRLAAADHLALLRLLWDHHPGPRLVSLGLPVTVVAPEAAESRGRFALAARDELAGLVRTAPEITVRRVRGDSELHAQQPDVVADLVRAAAAG
jgi:pimeloyl-ACP methyl ester carboxylesterase